MTIFKNGYFQTIVLPFDDFLQLYFTAGIYCLLEKLDNACIQAAICFFTVQYNILKLHSKGHSFFTAKYEI